MSMGIKIPKIKFPIKISGYSFVIKTALLVNAALIVALVIPMTTKTGQMPEINDLKGKNLSFEQLSDYFKKLSEVKGAPYAYNVLRLATLTPGVDLHLLGHIVGDELYKQKGLEGIYICTPDLQNACSHAIVTSYLYEHGAGALEDISGVCKKAPGGKTAYDQCFHGLGHGVLAYNDYDLRPAVTMCQSLAKEGGDGREDINCVGGAIMEMVGGGFHDRNAWSKERKVYFQTSNPLYPCTADFIPDKLKPICYTFLTPHLFDTLDKSIGQAGPAEYQEAIAFCDKVPRSDPNSRNACFGGFGKEFAILAIHRQILDLNSATDEQLANVNNWCTLVKDRDGLQACLMTALGSYYWGGENDPHISIRFCGVITDPAYHDMCFHHLIGSVGYFIADTKYKTKFCSDLPPGYREDCRAKLL